jgi:hypothetical protein
VLHAKVFACGLIVHNSKGNEIVTDAKKSGEFALESGPGFVHSAVDLCPELVG